MKTRQCRRIARVALAVAAATSVVAHAQPQPIDWSAPADFGALRMQDGGRADYSQLCESGNPRRDLERAV
jgi:hypothetical protein